MIILAIKIAALWLVLSFLLALAIGRMLRGRDELQLTEADIYDPRITELLLQAPLPIGAASCSRGGESHVRTAPAASLIQFHGRPNNPGAAQDHG